MAGAILPDNGGLGDHFAGHALISIDDEDAIIR
jgi:hypothetical protein